MTLSQWIYIKPDMMTSQDHQTTFVIIVDVDMRDQYKKDPSIPLAAVVDSFDVLRYDTGQSGKLVRPSKTELKDVFGTTNHDEIIVFMLEHGQCHGKPNVSNGEPGARTRNGKYATGMAY